MLTGKPSYYSTDTILTNKIQIFRWSALKGAGLYRRPLKSKARPGSLATAAPAPPLKGGPG